MKKLAVIFSLTLLFCSFISAQETPQGAGSGSGAGTKPADFSVKSNKKIVSKPLNITYKPRPPYTDQAREEGIEGKVRVRVTFLANGEIGSVVPVAALPFGLTEQAIAAARKMKFEPQMHDGVPVSVTKVVVFSFVIVTEEDSELVVKKAEINEMPTPQFPQDEKLKRLSGKVLIYAILQYDGTASYGKIITDLPKEFAESAAEAVKKIKFNPAVDNKGRNISVSRIIEYEFKSPN